jgi:hypothetical protein
MRAEDRTAARREKARLRSEKWRRAHGIGEATDARPSCRAQNCRSGVGAAPI